MKRFQHPPGADRLRNGGVGPAPVPDMRACRHGHAQRAVLQATSGQVPCRLPTARDQPLQPAQLLRRGQVALQRGRKERCVRARYCGSRAGFRFMADVARLSCRLLGLLMA